jgi:hypothetical protein
MSDELKIVREKLIKLKDIAVLLKKEREESNQLNQDKLESKYEEFSDILEQLENESSFFDKFRKFNENFELENDEIMKIMKKEFSKVEIEVLSIFYESQINYPILLDEDQELVMKFTELLKLIKTCLLKDF